MISKPQNQFIDLKYDARNKMAAGPYRGVGLPGKVGHRQLSPSERSSLKLPRGVSPLKFN